MAAKEGSRLQQFKASFNAFQFEIESRPQSPKMVSQEPIGARKDDTGLESLVKALQEEAFVLRGDLADWKRKGASAAQENAILKEEFEKTTAKLKAEVEGWRDRAAMSAGKGIVARRQLEDFAKQVKTLNIELQKCKEVAAEHEDGSSKLQASLEGVQAENKGLKAELNQWMQKAESAAKELDIVKSELNGSIKTLGADLENWKQLATRGNDEGRLHIHELEHSVRDLRAEVKEWEKSAKIEQIGTKLGQSEDGLEVQSGNPIEECNSVEGGDCSSQVSERSTSNEWRDGPSELEISLQAEIEDLKKKLLSSEQLEASLLAEIEALKKNVTCAEKEQEQLRQHYEPRVTELQVEVEAWKKRAACIAEDGKHERLDLEKKLKESLVKVRDANDFVAMERKRCAQEVAGVQAELKDWKVIAADASEECSSLRIAFDAVIQELQVELAQWKVKAETVSDEGKSVKAQFEKVVEDLENQVLVWKEKAESASEESSSLRIAFEALIKELQVELAQWKEKAETVSKDGESVKAELAQWKEKAETVSKEGESVKAELAQWKETAETVSKEGTSVKAELAQWKETAETVSEEGKATKAELALWKEKAATLSEEGKSLKAELEKVVGNLENQVLVWKEKAESALEGAAKNQEYADLVRTLDSELCLWRQRTQEVKSLHLELEEEQLELKESLKKTQNELQTWKDRAAAVTRSILSLQEDLCDVNEGGDDPLSVLESQLRKWKRRAEEGELKLKTVLAETQADLYEWKQKDAALTLATESLKEELDCVIEEGRLEREELNESINELQSGLYVWRERAQECQSLQTQLVSSQAEVKEWKEKLKSSQAELKEWKDKAVAITLTTRSLMDELDFRIEEGLQEKQEFCNSISALKESVLGWKAKAAENESMVVELNGTLLETQTALREWKDRATSVAMATESLKTEIDCTLEDYRLEKEELCNTINELEAEVYEWKARAQDSVTVQRQLERALLEMERKKRPLLRAHKSGSSG